MSGISDLFQHLSKLCSSCVFAAAATIFYKKTLKEDKLHIVGSLTALGFFLELLTTYPVYSYIGTSATTILLSYVCYRNWEWMKTALKMDLFCTFFLAIIDARFNLGGVLRIPYWTNVRIFATAFPQFLRKPLWLKTKLQDLRSKLGPIYILYVSNYVMARDVTGAQWLQQLGHLAMLSSVIAGVFFRPDNSAVLDLVAYLWKLHCDVFRTIFRPDEVVIGLEPYRTKLSERRYYHGRLMLCSLSCCAILSAADFFLDSGKVYL